MPRPSPRGANGAKLARWFRPLIQSSFATRLASYSGRSWVNLTALFGLTIFYLSLSWRKWPDPLIDFGRELYIPWRITQGAELYTDVHDIYGPFSHYFNALLFSIFGRGLMVLVTANLAVFSVILTSIYFLCRKAWGASAALAAGAVFVAVFGFSQFVGIGNYNYAAPYSHETTHGILVCLLLVGVLVRWCGEPTGRRSLLAGFLFGLSVVLKPEIMLAAGAVTLAAGVVRTMHRGWPDLKVIGAWLTGAMIPTFCFTSYFAASMSWDQAFGSASRAWLNVATKRTVLNTQIAFLGFDHPWQRLSKSTATTLFTCALIASIAAVAYLCQRTERLWLRFLLGGSLVTALIWLSCSQIVWLEAGQGLSEMMLIYVCICAISLRNGLGDISQAKITRLLLAVLGLTLLARMVLNPRIIQFGYYQAAIAGLLVPAVLIGELPERLRLSRFARGVVIAGVLALLAPGIVILTNASHKLLRLKTNSIGEGADRFYIFPPRSSQSDELVRLVTEVFRKQTNEQTVLVLPECVMINYLSGHASSTANVSDGSDDVAVKVLRQRPPDWVVLISRDLREYGIERYGEKPGGGKEIMDWVTENYAPAAKTGGDPLDPRQLGVSILRLKTVVR